MKKTKKSKPSPRKDGGYSSKKEERLARKIIQKRRKLFNELAKR